MKAPLVSITIASIYPDKNPNKVPLPKKLAQCSPDMKLALFRAGKDVEAKGGKFRLSDLFRSYDMQMASHMDYVAKRKKAYSPPPGGSLHEAGRAFDMDLDSMKISLADFWVIAAKYGLTPIIDKPTKGVSESWHFECRGSHGLVYDYYKAGKGDNFDKPYQAMAASAIVAVGVRLDKFGDGQDAAYVQSGLIRLGKVIGNLDGSIGPKSRTALDALGISTASVVEMVKGVDLALQKTFPGEYFDKTPDVPGIHH